MAEQHFLTHVTANESSTRHYIRCLEDRAIPLAAQDFMIAAADGVLGSRTCVHSPMASHSPFYSQPGLLADLLAGIAGESD